MRREIPHFWIAVGILVVLASLFSWLITFGNPYSFYSFVLLLPVIAPLWCIYFVYAIWRRVHDARVESGIISAEPKVKPARGLVYGVIGFVLVYGLETFISAPGFLGSNMLACNEGGVNHTITLGVSSCRWALIFLIAEIVLGVISLVYLAKTVPQITSSQWKRVFLVFGIIIIICVLIYAYVLWQERNEERNAQVQYGIITNLSS